MPSDSKTKLVFSGDPSEDALVAAIRAHTSATTLVLDHFSGGMCQSVVPVSMLQQMGIERLEVVNGTRLCYATAYVEALAGLRRIFLGYVKLAGTAAFFEAVDGTSAKLVHLDRPTLPLVRGLGQHTLPFGATVRVGGQPDVSVLLALGRSFFGLSGGYVYWPAVAPVPCTPLKLAQTYLKVAADAELQAWVTQTEATHGLQPEPYVLG